MIIQFETNFLSIGLFLAFFVPNLRSAAVKTLGSSVTNSSNGLFPRAAVNNNDDEEVVIPILSSAPEDNPDVPYYGGAPNYPHVQLDNFARQPPHPTLSDSPLPRSKSRKIDRRLSEEPDYFYSPNDQFNESPAREGRQSRGRRPTKKPKKMYKAVERVYYYPEDIDGDVSKNKRELNKMKDYSLGSYEPYYNDEDEEDTPLRPIKKDVRQMEDNPPRGEHEEPELDQSVMDSTQSSIANDVKQFGKEAVDEAHRFENFLDNLRNFAENSEKEYSSPKDDYGHSGQDDPNDGIYPNDDGDFGQRRRRNRNDENPVYTDSMASVMSNDKPEPTERTDRTRDYERPNNFGDHEDYDSEKDSYQTQRDQMERDDRRGGHRYHKDRRRRRRPSTPETDEEYDMRNREVSRLLDQETDEADYLSNQDVVRQLKNSEHKYNVGRDPVYSSQRDFDEVSRLEKMIENVALLNKEKEKRAANTHDRREQIEETRVNETKVKPTVKP